MQLLRNRTSIPGLICCVCFQIAVALSAAPAIAQIGGSGQLQCNTYVAVTPNLRGEGYTELVGDITLTCTGGTAPAIGAVIPQVSFTVSYNSAVTSRLLPQTNVSGAISEALLLVDEPNSGLPGLAPNFGSAAGQNLCTTPLQGCVEYASSVAGVVVATDTPQGTSATTNGKNVFQGVVNGNSVTFFGIPVLAPGAAALRVFRITNVRVNANPLSGGPGPAVPVQASILVSGATSLILNNPTPNVGFVNSGLTASASPSTSQDQCTSLTKAPVNILTFAGNFVNSFKTRVLASGNMLYAGQGATSTQTIPGSVYNTESNLVLPIAAGQTAGFSDYGTRLKAQFNGVPVGVHLFVSAANVQNNGLPAAVPAVIGGFAANQGITYSRFAQLTANETGAFSAVAASSFAPGNSGSVPVVEIPMVNGSGTAVWEVINTNPSVTETFGFAVYTSYTANFAQNSPPPGTATVNLSYAATPPSFTANNGAAASATLPIPRFVPDATSARNLLTIVASTCGGPASTSMALTAVSNGGANVYSLTATVTTPSPALTGAPVGTVTFYDNGTAIGGGPVAVSSGGTANLLAILSSSSNRLSAVFTPANIQAFTSSTSPDVLISFGRTNASMDITSNLYPSLPGQAVTFTATVSGSAPNGIVQFTDGAQPLGSAALVGGRASFTATLTTVGVHDIFGTYGGDGGNSGVSARFGQRVERVTGTLSLIASMASADFGQSVTWTAALSPQAPAGVAAPGGTVLFQEGAAVVGSAPLSSGSATLAVSNLTVGAHQIFATYGGDANWYGVRSSAITITVNRAATATMLTSSATMTEVRLAGTLTPAANGGTVQFLDVTTNTELGTAPALNGTAALSLAPADAAKIAGHNVTAVYSGGAGFAGSTSNTLLLPALRNAAGGPSPQFAPEELVTLSGGKLADAAQPALAGALPQSLGGLSVNVADSSGAVFAAGLSYVSPSQVNFVIPPGLTRGAALVTVMRAGVVVAALPVTLAPVAPGIFGYQIQRADNGAVYLVLYGTGIRNRSDSAAVTCLVNGTPLPVAYAGAQPDFTGLDQVNVLLPSDLPAKVLTVSLTVDGQASNVVTTLMQ